MSILPGHLAHPQAQTCPTWTKHASHLPIDQPAHIFHLAWMVTPVTRGMHPLASEPANTCHLILVVPCVQHLQLIIARPVEQSNQRLQACQAETGLE